MDFLKFFGGKPRQQKEKKFQVSNITISEFVQGLEKVRDFK